MTYSVRNIVIALVLAAVAAGLVILYTGNVQKQAHDQPAERHSRGRQAAIAGR